MRNDEKKRLIPKSTWRDTFKKIFLRSRQKSDDNENVYTPQTKEMRSILEGGSIKDRVDNLPSGYKRLKVDPDGDCGYTAFGVTRQQAYQLLNEHLAEVKNLLIPAVREQLLLERFFQYLQQHGRIRGDLTHADVIDNIGQFENDLDIIAAYVSYDVSEKNVDAGWAHPAVLQALAHIQGVNLRIWQLGDGEALIPHSQQQYAQYNPPSADQTRDLLFINGNHFEQLKFVECEPGESDTPIYPLDSSQNQERDVTPQSQVAVTCSTTAAEFQFNEIHVMNSTTINSTNINDVRVHVEGNTVTDLNSIGSKNHIAYKRPDIHFFCSEEHASTLCDDDEPEMHVDMQPNSARVLIWQKQRSRYEGHVAIIIRHNDTYHYVSLYKKDGARDGASLSNFKYYCCCTDARIVDHYFANNDGDRGQTTREADFIVDIKNLQTNRMVAYLEDYQREDNHPRKVNLQWRLFGDCCCCSKRYHNCSSIVHELLKEGGIYSKEFFGRWWLSYKYPWVTTLLKSILLTGITFGVSYGSVKLADEFFIPNEDLNLKEELGLTGVLTGIFFLTAACVGGGHFIWSHCIKDHEEIMDPVRLKKFLVDTATDPNCENVQFFNTSSVIPNLGVVMRV